MLTKVTTSSLLVEFVDPPDVDAVDLAGAEAGARCGPFAAGVGWVLSNPELIPEDPAAATGDAGVKEAAFATSEAGALSARVAFLAAVACCAFEAVVVDELWD